MLSRFESIFHELNEQGVRYIVVGGVAVVLHGFPRLTLDLDLVVDLAPLEAAKAMTVLGRMGLKPLSPVEPMGFADASIREVWVREKSMKVLSFADPAGTRRNVDIFVQHPIPFEAMWDRARVMPLDRATVRVASLDDLIELKRLAGRAQDLTDIAMLEEIRRLRGLR